MICSLNYGRGSKPNKYHRGQQCPDEDNRFPRDENEKSHTTTPRTNGGEQLRHYKSEALGQSGFLAALSAVPRVRKRSFQIGG